MAKRLTEKQKDEIINFFIAGINIEQLAKQYFCTKLTISRNLKKNLGENKYKELFLKSQAKDQLEDYKHEMKDNKYKIDNTDRNFQKISKKQVEKNFFEVSEFVEVAPLNCDIDNTIQKDLSSIPIADVDFPNTVFMIVDNKVELAIKYLKDYPKWHFLSQDELKRKTIEIYIDIKIAKGFCGKDQKVIKVPNTDVLRLVAPILRSRGISRMISADTLIAL